MFVFGRSLEAEGDLVNNTFPLNNNTNTKEANAILSEMLLYPVISCRFSFHLRRKLMMEFLTIKFRGLFALYPSIQSGDDTASTNAMSESNTNTLVPPMSFPMMRYKM